jgi:hypothetical protein
VFEYGDPETVNEYYNENVKKKFSKKYFDSRVLILRGDLPQMREQEKQSISKEADIRARSRVVRARLKDVKIEAGVHACAALTLCSESNWKWQWALLELGTSRYLAGFSPSFPNFESAERWMAEEIDNL